MLCSEVLLCLFLAYWLLGQWNAEEQNLRTDVKLKFTTVARTVTDSAMKARVMGSVLKGAPDSSKTRHIILRDEQILQSMPEPDAVLKPTVFVHRSIYSNGRDSIMIEDDRDTTVERLLAGVQELVSTLMPDSLKNAFAARDTARIRMLFQQSLAADGQHFRFVWDGNERPGTFRVRGDGINRHYAVAVTGYQSYLIQKLLPQLIFALGLILISSFAFLLAWRSLQRERRLSLMKNSLVSNMSHELKTPVSTVKVALEALTEEEVLEDRDTVREYVRMANSELKRLELLVNSTLHNSLLESGKLSMQCAPIDLEQLTSEIVSSLQLRVQAQRSNITLAFAPGDYSIMGDRLHLQGVIQNVLDNALKYGGEGVQISITGSSNSKEVRLAIADNGPGIPKEYHRRVFEQFFRVPTGDIHEVKGYGLGLNYAAEVMRQHGGSISVSAADHSGALFTLIFPRTTA